MRINLSNRFREIASSVGLKSNRTITLLSFFCPFGRWYDFIARSNPFVVNRMLRTGDALLPPWD